MKYRKLGRSSLSISVISLGTWQLADSAYWGEDGDPIDAVRSALDHGINCFDTAETYADGASETVLGKALKGVRDKAVIATKVTPAHLAPADVAAACEGSLRRLGTDVIDLYQVHWPNWDIPFSDTHAALQRLKEQGKIREFGLSNFGPRDLKDWMECGSAVSNQLCYNVLFRGIEFEIAPACERYGIGILAYSPMMQGILSGRWKTIEDIPVVRRRTRHFAADREKTRHGASGCEAETVAALKGIEQVAREAGHSMADISMAWLLARPGVTSIIVGGRKPEQIARNVRAVDIALDDAMMDRLDAVTDPVKQALGSNPDPWLAGDQSRIR